MMILLLFFTCSILQGISWYNKWNMLSDVQCNSFYTMSL